MNKQFILILIFLNTSIWAQPSGNALVFDGINDYVDCGNDASLNINTALTLEAWVRPSAIANARIISKWGTNSGYEMVFINNEIWFTINQSQRAAYDASSLVDQWAHLAVTYDGVNSAIYLNGDLVDTGYNGQLDIVNTGLILKIGNISNAGNSYFSGAIDEVRIWNRERTQAQIQSTMNTTLGQQYYSSADSGLAGYWQFEDGQGNTASDLSINMNHGIIYGAVWDDNMPLTFNLLTPLDEDTLIDLTSPVEFKWRTSVDLDEDPVSYSIRISGEAGSDTALNAHTDTTLTFDGSMFFQYDSQYQWYVLSSDGEYMTSSADTFRFHTPANNAPLSFNLLRPLSEDTLIDLTAPVQFVWQSSVDPEGDPVSYSFRISGGTNLDTTINELSDTTLSFAGGPLFEYASQYYWYVLSSDGEYTTSSADTSLFYTRAIVNTIISLSGIPETFSLKQNYPNPFNPATRIKFNLSKSELVKINIYNNRGQKVQRLVQKTMPAGRHQVEFNGQNLPSGIYFYAIEAGKFQQVKKMILIK